MNSTQANVKDSQSIVNLNSTLKWANSSIDLVVKAVNDYLQSVQRTLDMQSKEIDKHFNEAKQELERAKQALSRCQSRCSQQNGQCSCGAEQQMVSQATQKCREWEAKRKNADSILIDVRRKIEEYHHMPNPRSSEHGGGAEHELIFLSQYLGACKHLDKIIAAIDDYNKVSMATGDSALFGPSSLSRHYAHSLSTSSIYEPKESDEQTRERDKQIRRNTDQIRERQANDYNRNPQRVVATQTALCPVCKRPLNICRCRR